MDKKSLVIQSETVNYYIYDQHKLSLYEILQIIEQKDYLINSEWEKLITAVTLYFNVFDSKSDLNIRKEDLRTDDGVQILQFLSLKANVEQTLQQYQSKLKTLYNEKLDELDAFLKFYQYTLNRVKQNTQWQPNQWILLEIGELWQQFKNKK